MSLDDYVKRMAMKQKDIYFITGESENAARTSPHLEIFQKNDIEVLLLSDPVDEWLVTSLTEFDGKSLKSVAKGGLNLPRKNSRQWVTAGCLVRSIWWASSRGYARAPSP